MTHPKGTSGYPLLVVAGPQGTGKSMLCRIIRQLVDNHAAGVEMFPTDIKDIAISSHARYVLIYDNGRALTKKWSDTLCIVSTSGSIGSRKLYSDDQESLLIVHAPVVLNGIHDFIKEPDLASRCVTVQLLPLGTNARRDEQAIAQDLEQKLPTIFKGLLDLAAKCLHAESSVTVAHPERMMDFCRWLAAMEIVLNLPSEQLQKAYSANLRQAALDIVQDNVLAITVLKFAQKSNKGHWIGTATDLLTKLDKLVTQTTRRRHTEWPQSAITLGKRLKYIAPVLKPQGVTITSSHGTQRQIEISYVQPKA
jgi:hypothetical protein